MRGSSVTGLRRVAIHNGAAFFTIWGWPGHCHGSAASGLWCGFATRIVWAAFRRAFGTNRVVLFPRTDLAQVVGQGGQPSPPPRNDLDYIRAECRCSKTACRPRCFKSIHVRRGTHIALYGRDGYGGIIPAHSLRRMEVAESPLLAHSSDFHLHHITPMRRVAFN